MNKVFLAIVLLTIIGCQKKQNDRCHTVFEFHDTNPIDVKKVFTASFKEVSCNLYSIEIVHYNGKSEIIYMDYYHQVVQKK